MTEHNGWKHHPNCIAMSGYCCELGCDVPAGKNTPVPPPLPENDGRSEERDEIANFLSKRGLLGESNAVRWWPLYRERLMVEHDKCKVPPPGWWCSREAGHEPPCAARKTGDKK